METPEQKRERRKNERGLWFALAVYAAGGWLIYWLLGLLGLDEEIRYYVIAIYSVAAIFSFEWLRSVYDAFANRNKHD